MTGGYLYIHGSGALEFSFTVQNVIWKYIEIQKRRENLLFFVNILLRDKSNNNLFLSYYEKLFYFHQNPILQKNDKFFDFRTRKHILLYYYYITKMETDNKIAQKAVACVFLFLIIIPF
ncbi:hypothetical protein AUK10_02245 [Candidatus Gracilibacteria bacterium CG2_30_37_12]|nr:MAG: hypothetical protein AUK10_02245 [Candidatus Gracilibacteria bacterium CG2_30_37_12]